MGRGRESGRATRSTKGEEMGRLAAGKERGREGGREHLEVAMLLAGGNERASHVGVAEEPKVLVHTHHLTTADGVGGMPMPVPDMA
eukprot:1565276-Rhodomonas_salina.5